MARPRLPCDQAVHVGPPWPVGPPRRQLGQLLFVELLLELQLFFQLLELFVQLVQLELGQRLLVELQPLVQVAQVQQILQVAQVEQELQEQQEQVEELQVEEQQELQEQVQEREAWRRPVLRDVRALCLARGARAGGRFGTALGFAPLRVGAVAAIAAVPVLLRPVPARARL